MTPARVHQVSVGPGGVPKKPVARARVTRLGPEGNGHAHPRVHGGPDQAVLVVAREWLDRLAASGFDVFPGALGENLTTEGLEYHALPVGARFRAGSVLLRVTKARVPCDTIERACGRGIGKAIFNARVRAGDATDGLWGASGLMCAVEEEGDVAPGDPVTVR